MSSKVNPHQRTTNIKSFFKKIFSFGRTKKADEKRAVADFVNEASLYYLGNSETDIELNDDLSNSFAAYSNNEILTPANSNSQELNYSVKMGESLQKIPRAQSFSDLAALNKEKKDLPPINKDELYRLLRKKDVLYILCKKFPLNPKFKALYEPKELLGDGAFGFVMVAERISDKTDVAVKFILKSKVNHASWTLDPDYGVVPLEVHILKSMKHPGIVQFLDYFEDEKYIYMVTEMHGTPWDSQNPKLNSQKNPGLRPIDRPKQECNNLLTFFPNDPRLKGEAEALRAIAQKIHFKPRTSSDLFECIDAHYRLPEATIKKIFQQVLSAIAYLHKNGIVHRDIKDENIVVDENYNAKIIDFGSASFIPKENGGLFEHFNGTIQFAAPEILREKRFNAEKAETWALGVLLFTMLFNENPFPDQQRIMRGELVIPYKVDESKNSIMHLIRRMLCIDHTKRPYPRELLNHPWLLHK